MENQFNEDELKDFGKRLGQYLAGGEVLELIGDVGAGKTVFTKGLALGLGIDEPIQSPTFTISRVYENDAGLRLAHYDFYRLNEPGIMREEISETVAQENTVVVVEWSDIVKDILPDDRLSIKIIPQDNETRTLRIEAFGNNSRKVLEAMK